jgi:ERCC4-related helicase
VVQLKAALKEKRQADWASKRVFFCTPEVCGVGVGGGSLGVGRYGSVLLNDTSCHP